MLAAPLLSLFYVLENAAMGRQPSQMGMAWNRDQRRVLLCHQAGVRVPAVLGHWWEQQQQAGSTPRQRGPGPPVLPVPGTLREVNPKSITVKEINAKPIHRQALTEPCCIVMEEANLL
ncbi:hypothetical protein AAY473_037459 [Plecturocebus cupreus]